MATFLDSSVVKQDLSFCPMCGKSRIKGVDPLIGLCKDCFEESLNMDLKLFMLLIDGHNWHCCQRQAFGDGECECSPCGTLLWIEGFHLIIKEFKYMWE
jgi:hypothetical protein